MPIIYEYLGIKLGFYSNEHYPIHIHAYYGSAVIKVLIYKNEEGAETIKYIKDIGTFPPAKLKQLKSFVNKKKDSIIYAWQQFFEYDVDLKKITITKKV